MKIPFIRKNNGKEIVVGQFGMQKALASYDVSGNVCFFRIDIEAQLFTEKKGKGVVASVIEDDLWFDICAADGLFFGKSPQSDIVVQAFESDPGRDTESSRFLTYSFQNRVILRRRKEEKRPICVKILQDLAFLAAGFALSFRKLMTPSAELSVPSPPYLLLPKTSSVVCPDFSKDLVLLQ